MYSHLLKNHILCKMYSPLISVAIVTYNSSEYIVETLDSVKNQSYQKIEVIISDDCSTDKTVDLCSNWIHENASRFVRCRLITSQANTGVAVNCNRALEAATGEWYKMLDGDDVLFPNCLSDFAVYIDEHPDRMCIASGVNTYQEFIDDTHLKQTDIGIKDNFYGLDLDSQLKSLARGNGIVSSSVILNTSFLRKIGGFETKYFYEDYPLFLTVLEAGQKIWMMNSVTCGYRLHASLSRSNEKLFNYKYKCYGYHFQIERCAKYYSLNYKIRIRLIQALHYVFEKIGLNSVKYSSLYLFAVKFIQKITA